MSATALRLSLVRSFDTVSRAISIAARPSQSPS
jgi:hypothetical protein